mmetsp:Transcript_112047/g.322039  ORF Transcript_112047/g.322039 Transcript_112047/m.322039 type:complete len:208 (+) Transcript_112047:143-766(+)
MTGERPKTFQRCRRFRLRRRGRGKCPHGTCARQRPRLRRGRMRLGNRRTPGAPGPRPRRGHMRLGNRRRPTTPWNRGLHGWRARLRGGFRHRPPQVPSGSGRGSSLRLARAGRAPRAQTPTRLIEGLPEIRSAAATWPRGARFRPRRRPWVRQTQTKAMRGSRPGHRRAAPSAPGRGKRRPRSPPPTGGRLCPWRARASTSSSPLGP